MKLPTMTKGKHWLALFILVLVEVILAFLCFAYTPVPLLGLLLIILGNMEWIVAAYLGIKNSNI